MTSSYVTCTCNRPLQSLITVILQYDDPTTIRRPCFKDDSNNLCAVGHLIACTAGMDVVEKINNAFKFEYIRDMDHAVLAEWHVDQGLSLIELAMVRQKSSVKAPLLINSARTFLTPILFQK
jgi:hypothetical protein